MFIKGGKKEKLSKFCWLKNLINKYTLELKMSDSVMSFKESVSHLYKIRCNRFNCNLLHILDMEYSTMHISYMHHRIPHFHA